MANDKEANLFDGKKEKEKAKSPSDKKKREQPQGDEVNLSDEEWEKLAAAGAIGIQKWRVAHGLPARCEMVKNPPKGK
jgi:hypothetical protein